MEKLTNKDKLKLMTAGTLLKLDAIRRGEGKPALLTQQQRKDAAAELAKGNKRSYGILEANKKVRAFRNEQ